MWSYKIGKVWNTNIENISTYIYNYTFGFYGTELGYSKSYGESNYSPLSESLWMIDLVRLYL